MMYIHIYNRNWVDTRWQQYITHLHTNSTHNTGKGKWHRERKIGKCGPFLVFASYAMTFALQLRKKHGKTSWMRRPWPTGLGERGRSVAPKKETEICNTQFMHLNRVIIHYNPMCKLSCLNSKTHLSHFPNSHSFYWNEKKNAWLEVQNSRTGLTLNSPDHLHEQTDVKARIENKNELVL
jgi:hypothetical protein